MSNNKPFPSSDLGVLKDNSLILDNFVNSQDNEYPDRFGRKRPTITGIIKEAFNVRTDISNMNETLIGQSRWDVVPKNTSLSLGGDNGALNKQAQALFNRTVMLKIHSREALRRTYQEVGLVLVPGSFEEGGTLNTIADVLLEEKTGKVYSWTGSFPKVVNKGTLPTSEVEFVDKSGFANTVIYMTRETAKEHKNFLANQRVIITDTGLEYTFKLSRNLIPGQSFSEIDYDDEITILVNSGGMLQFSDWGKLSKIHNKNKAKFSGVLKDRTTTISLDFYGNSETFGQALPNTPLSQNLINVPTGFGDNSKHEHWRYNNNYPQWVVSSFTDNYFNHVMGNNLGYSGDRMYNALLRHRNKTNSLLAVLCYGINDALFCTNNGKNPENLVDKNNPYNVENFGEMLSLMVAKQILQGKEVVVLGTVVFGSLSGFDGTQFSAAKLTRSYNAVAKTVAETFGCKWVDTAADILNQYSMVEITQEGTHLNENGHKIVGNRLAAALMLNENTQKVGPGSVIIANPNTNVIASKTGGNVLPNSSSTTPLGDVTNEKTTMVVLDHWLTIPFYAETDNLVCYFNGLSNAQGVDVEISLDNNSLQSDLHFKYSFLPHKPVGTKRKSTNLFNRETENITDPNSLCVIIANKGWHTLSIKRGSGTNTLLLDSILFESLQTVIDSDLFGTTGYLIVKNKQLVFGCKNIKSISDISEGVVDVTFTRPMANLNYNVSCDIESGNIATMHNVIKTLTGFSVRCLTAQGAGQGLNFVPFTPFNMTCLITGGR